MSDAATEPWGVLSLLDQKYLPNANSSLLESLETKSKRRMGEEQAGSGRAGIRRTSGVSKRTQHASATLPHSHLSEVLD